MTTKCFYCHFHVYVLAPSDETDCYETDCYFIKHSDLADFHPYCLYTSLSVEGSATR